MVTSFLNRFAPINFDGYIDRLTDRFTGREWLFEQHIDPWLQQQSKEQFYLLTGEPGVGKSAIAQRLTQFSQSQESLHPDLLPSFLNAIHICSARDST
jgi:Cdc6-like AAA superfamily ATPase